MNCFYSVIVNLLSNASSKPYTEASQARSSKGTPNGRFCLSLKRAKTIRLSKLELDNNEYREDRIH